MKLKVLKQHSIYKVYNSLSGDEIFTNFKPTQTDLFFIAQKENWSGNDENRSSNVSHGNYDFCKIKIYWKQ